ncbi:hypothetical protein JNJ66_05160 [Candidatus Saccharibacteria bacterium]|nr:hypothetical protein [Candidatus Saccharibacteria bacterium]
MIKKLVVIEAAPDRMVEAVRHHAATEGITLVVEVLDSERIAAMARKIEGFVAETGDEAYLSRLPIAEMARSLAAVDDLGALYGLLSPYHHGEGEASCDCPSRLVLQGEPFCELALATMVLAALAEKDGRDHVEWYGNILANRDLCGFAFRFVGGSYDLAWDAGVAE